MYKVYFPGKNFLQRFVIPYFANYLRIWDVTSSDRVDQYISNSKFVAKRIKKYYGRDAIVVYPPCIKEIPKMNFIYRDNFFLIVSALVPYKKVDLAIQAFNESKDKLIIAGNGPDLAYLKKIAKRNIEFIESPSRELINELYQRAKALIFPGIEDFGIVPVEAQSFGCPVIAYRRGGTLETVLDQKTGIFFDEQTPLSLLNAIERFKTLKFKEKDFVSHIKKFTYQNFCEKIKTIISKYI